uniref:Uncharacterized protein n=1 Tax=Stomoxys calcitrans TaxID=35570 RepID=A0A1I8NUW8_STOCA
MTSYDTLSNSDYQQVNSEGLSKSGTFHRMIKYWRNSPKTVDGLKKSSSFIEYRKHQSNVLYQRLESFDESKLESLRRQHAFMTNGGAQKSNGGGSLTHSPERLRGATHDLFELLERVQCSRLEDQRCELPAYFSQPCGCSKLEHLDGRPPTQKCLQAMLCFPVCLSTASAIKMFFNTQKSKICHFSQNNASSQQSPKLVMTQFHIADKRCGAAQKRTPFFLPRAVH